MEEKDLNKMTDEEYREVLIKMIGKIDDNKKLRKLCIVVHDYSGVEYP